MGHPGFYLLFLLEFFPGIFLFAEDSGENLVDIFQLAVQVEGVFDLLARDFAGDFFVGEDELVKV